LVRSNVEWRCAVVGGDIVHTAAQAYRCQQRVREPLTAFFKKIIEHLRVRLASAGPHASERQPQLAIIFKKKRLPQTAIAVAHQEDKDETKPQECDCAI
jgi:hypothetical protein